MANGFGYLRCIPEVHRGGGSLGDCFACGKEAYLFYSGECDPDGPQLEPDVGHCWFCGFDYSQHCKHPMAEQVAEFCVAEVPVLADLAVRRYRRVLRLENMIVGGKGAVARQIAIAYERDRILRRRDRASKHKTT